MTSALIGRSGFVGTTLQRQHSFDVGYRSTDIHEARGRHFTTVVCCAAPAQKWIANRDPEADAANVDALIGHLRTLSCERFVLISTVDVFLDPRGVDESTPVDGSALPPYGLNRRRLEQFVQAHFDHRLVVRLPGLVGPGLRKNVIYDLKHDNNLGAVDSRGVFQYYPMVNLWADLQRALELGLDLVHLTAEPISVAEVSQQGFGRSFSNTLESAPSEYDLRSRHAEAMGGRGAYTYSRRETLQAVRSYAQADEQTVPGAHG